MMIGQSALLLMLLGWCGAETARAGVGGMPAAAPDTLNVTPHAFKNVGIDQHLNQQIPPNLVFRDSNGKSIRLGDVFDGTHPVILDLAYYNCPMLCTMVLNDLNRTLKVMPLDIGKDFRVVTVSFDPSDKPPLAHAKKATYVHEYGRPGAQTGWLFLTGDEASIQKLTDAVGFRYHYDDKTKQFVHPTGVTILTPEGKISKYFFGINYKPVDIRLALVDASQRKIGSLTDQILLFCCQYDASTGRYGWAVMGALRVGGALMLVAMGSLLFVMMRRERAGGAALAAGADSGDSLKTLPPTDGVTD
jgi:protein SCO1/2